MNTTEQFINFAAQSPDCFHAVKSISDELIKNGFSPLNEYDEWNIKHGGKHFVTRNMSSVIAFKIPENEPKSFMITAAHTDSPSYKIKPSPEIECEGGKYVKLNVEGYGGMIHSTWLDRPLSVSGRAAVKTENGIEIKLINIDRDLLVIPNAAIHMNRDANSGYKFNIQKDMLPLFGETKGFMKTIAECADTQEEFIKGFDLYLYNRTKGTTWGNNNEFFSCSRIDNLQCSYAALKSLIDGGNDNTISVMAAFDNEEVGSGTKQGALSDFLSGTLERICECLGYSRNKFYRMTSSGFMLSADNAHAVHPNMGEKADPVNRPVMNGGVVIKYNSQQKYTTDCVSEAVFKEICENAAVPYQMYLNRSDVPGGSTLGNLSSEKVSMNTVDIGLAQLAMHSSYETAGCRDTDYMIKAMTEFYNSYVHIAGNGKYEIKKK